MYRLHPERGGPSRSVSRLHAAAILSGSRDGAIHALLAWAVGCRSAFYSAALVEGLAFGAPGRISSTSPASRICELLVDRGSGDAGPRSADEIPVLPVTNVIDTSALFEPNGLAKFRDAVARIVGSETTLAAA